MKRILGLFAAIAIVLCVSLGAFAQGKGGGKGSSGGRGNGGGKGSNGPVFGGGDSNRGRGGNDDSIGGSRKEKNKNKGNTNDILGGSNSENRGNNRYKGLSKKTGVPEDALRARFEAEKALNPKLTHGQFVAAHMISKNHKGISTSDILSGLRNGDSIGQVLHDRGWDKDRIKKERKRIKKEMKNNRDNNDDDDDFDDDDSDWKF